MEIEVTMGEAIKSVESPTHPTAVQLGQHGKGKKGKGRANDQEHDSRKALVTLSQTPAELLKDFVLLITTVTPHFISTPQALLETHPTIPGHQALKVTLVPRFKMPGTQRPEKTEVIFLVDRSGSMSDTIPYVKSALRVFLKSLPLGCFFNIISFGSQCTLLWERSRAYGEGTLRIASHHIETFDASYGGTELLPPLIQAFSQRRSEPGVSTEIMVLTDGEIWSLPELLEYIQQMRKESGGAVRLFSLGVGERVSHALVQGIAMAGGGYSQIVSSGGAGGGRVAESLEAKVVRILNSALTDHIGEYKLHVLQEEGDEVDSESEGEEEGAGTGAQVTPAHPAPVRARAPAKPSGRINLFDPTAAPPQRPPTPPSPNVNLTPNLGSYGDSRNGFANLKKLQGPEITQSPFEIPPLFPYERSVVYLLIPPTAKQLKYAKLVTLSATTIFGQELTLSIPIIRLEQPGETVHQLAARMLLRDLEEGKSWLHSGKYGVSAGDLSEVREYIQREGEEVGMRWSLASKWTSFIGVEEEILNEAPMPSPVPPEGKPSGLAEGRLSAPSIPSILPETTPDSEDSMSINTSGTSGSDHVPLSRLNPTHSPSTAIGSRARWGVIAGVRAMSSGVDPMGRLLESRDTPGPEHPVWNPHAQNYNPNSYQQHGRPTMQPELIQGRPLAASISSSTEGSSGFDSPYNLQSLGAVWRVGNIFSRSAPPERPPEDPSGSIMAPTLEEPSQTIVPPTGLHPSVVDGGLLATVDTAVAGEGGSPGQSGMRAPNRMPVPPQPPAGSPVNIYRLIAAQNFDGSFPVADEYVVELLGSRNDPMPQACGGDKVAWVALLIAVLLERKYAYLRDVWELVVRKIWVFLGGREGVKVEEVKLAAEELVAAWE
ncbi:unnamed protein product, partial [Tuber aestivum]